MGYRERHAIPDLGIGIGLRSAHIGHVLRQRPAMSWFEIISENFFADGGATRTHLNAICDNYRLVPHGVSLSIGGSDAIDRDYLRRLRALARRVGAPWCSDHLCWTGTRGIDVHDLLPMPYTPETLAHVAERVRLVQGELELPFALENVSSYVEYRESSIPEGEFLAKLAEAADCGILLDVNNIFVNAYNHGLDANGYIDVIPSDRVVQIHLAGHTDNGTHLLDTHSDHVCGGVWQLYRRAIHRFGAVATLVEWDEAIPSWDILAAEGEAARIARDEALLAFSGPTGCRTAL